jgi:hypothetical protein
LSLDCVEASGQASSHICNQIMAVADCSNMTRVTTTRLGRAVAYWLRHYATNKQFAGSIADGVIGILQ